MSSMVDHLVAEVLSLDIKLLACQARLAASTDSEALHDLRTTVRRLRSVLRPLREISGATQLEDAAKAVGQLTTPLRDMQVLAALLEKNSVQDPRLHEAALKRNEHLSRACPNVATSPELNRLLTLIDQFPTMLRVQQRQGMLRGLRKTIEKRMDKQWRKLRVAIAEPGHDRHDLRLLIKRVRYAAEAYPELSHQPKNMQARLKSAQGELGDWHDHLQWLAQAETQADLAPCIPAWQVGIVRAERKAEASLKRLAKACF
ncbi:CHAD domain-containing protein [Pseudomonas syringae]|uniref:CHAD domain-containing protein n=1 Tax=Pseudomonas syringae TaxID=317 RepID=A0A9Q4FFI1_PSESX|nr:CHAD domain-containing protein [Pseudomonas syringae]MCF5470338.1 CHAD domain-containing protein [Pseudomonas syringae]MCF5475557.1 CHAD domain-containing protein [Pseudomonas syringae]MCF5485449.1 CHAD domain-containing protein [Pseudomonas syringae]MCF5489831.1 CHAD domain-containing protein [Pseudomonas syringae]MCF5494815.1 CHAD domain-containing protein [Pseudomonas syringae]